MITIFTTPKKFEGHTRIIQTNAITSWTLLKPECEVILFGREPGTREIAEKLNIKHFPGIKTNESGTPLVNDMFEVAEELGAFPIFTFVNSDIILCSDFIRAVSRIRIKEYLLVARRWNIRMDEYIDFSGNSWEKRIQMEIQMQGKVANPQFIDMFTFTRGIWKNLPPFAVGRAEYDLKLLYLAYSERIPLVNISPEAKVVHQNHDYSHHPQGQRGVYFGEEAKRNARLVKHCDTSFNIRNASFVLIKHACVPALTFGHLRAALRTISSTSRHNKISHFFRFIRKAAENSAILRILERMNI